MSEQWHEFLRARGAVPGDGAVRDFGDPPAERRAARDGAVLVDLSHLALIHAGGADARTFLNGQLTSDVAALDSDSSQLGAWCSAKGRMLALFRVLPWTGGYLLQLPGVLREEVSRRLRLYVLRAKVTLAPAETQLVRLGLAGSDAPALLHETLGAAPGGDNRLAPAAGGVVVLRVPGAHPRFELLVPAERAPALWQTLARKATPAGIGVWTWHEVMAGLPEVLPATRELFIPQETNLDLLGGVSFTKGCYTGQEIVARVHYRGRVKQRMYRARVEAERVPQPGETVHAVGASQAVGRVVIAARGPEEGCDLLAVLYSDKIDAELHLGSADGPRLTIEALPYPIPTD